MVPTAAAAWAARGDGGSPAGLILNIEKHQRSSLQQQLNHHQQKEAKQSSKIEN